MVSGGVVRHPAEQETSMMKSTRNYALILGALVALSVTGSCGRSSDSVNPSGVTPGPGPDPGPGSSVVLVGAGDIGSSANAEATAKLLDNIPGTVFTAGDNAYPDGSTSDFDNYDHHWGRHKARTRPAPGNHEYNSSGAAPYYRYFGSNAGPSGR